MRGPLLLAAALAAFAYCAGVTIAPLLQEADADTLEASYYGSESGTTTASGEPFDPQGLTAAHRSLPFGTRLLVRHEGRGVVVTVNDRGPAEWTGHDLDLSEGAARAIGLTDKGAGTVEVEQVESAKSGELPKTGAPK